MNLFKFSFFLLSLFTLAGCIGSFNPNGSPPPDYPFFETTKPRIIKKISVPIGTKLIYDEHFLKKGKQDKIMSEETLHTIEFPEGKPINWAGVPVSTIVKFYNSEMCGYTVYAKFEQLDSNKETKFSKLWQTCSDDLGVTVKNADDWSFNTKNISDIESCSVIYQRYFKEDTNQQLFLDSLYGELIKIGEN